MVSFRLAVGQDYKAIAALHARSWQQNYRGTFSDRFLDIEVVADRTNVWKERLENPKEDQWVYIAQDNGVLIGFICAYLDKDPRYGTLIDNLHVQSTHIGQGIGERLMVEAAHFLKKKNREALYLWVLTTNTKAIRFYKRLGGVPQETVTEFDIGDREIVKTRYYWQSLEPLVSTSKNLK